jgi:protein-S-isoprenylcysteine O-methyltransferase Ste14
MLCFTADERIDSQPPAFQMISIIDHWLQPITTLTGIVVILIPLMGFRRTQTHTRGRSSGTMASLLRWPVMLAQTVLLVVIGIALWRPLPILLSPGAHVSALIIGSLLYFPGVALYLWGYWTLDRMFGISSGFGATLYQDHQLIQGGPYHFIRHPMCLAVILAAFGALLIFYTWAMVLFSVLSLVVVFRAQREERLLAEEFGEEWNQYRRDIPGWLPAFRKRLK